MSKLPNLFLDSSALVAGIASPNGAAHALLVLSETGRIVTTVSEQVIVETERAFAKKFPALLADVRQSIRSAKSRILANPLPAEVKANLGLIAHEADVPIVLAAMRAQVDFLVTHNRKHFLDDPGVATRSGLKLGTPAEALTWIRQYAAAP